MATHCPKHYLTGLRGSGCIADIKRKKKVVPVPVYRTGRGE